MPLIWEGLVATCDALGRPHLAPMGPWLEDNAAVRAGHWQQFALKPFQGSQTYANLCRHPFGIFHLTDDVRLFVAALFHDFKILENGINSDSDASAGSDNVPDDLWTAAASVPALRLSNCCQYWEFEIIMHQADELRPTLTAKVRNQAQLRPFMGFNRAKHAVVEAAILISRLHILPLTQIQQQMEWLRPWVDKTGGEQEKKAFAFLEQHVSDFRLQNLITPAD